jgi:hypothetical protein
VLVQLANIGVRGGRGTGKARVLAQTLARGTDALTCFLIRETTQKAAKGESKRPLLLDSAISFSSFIALSLFFPLLYFFFALVDS